MFVHCYNLLGCPPDIKHPRIRRLPASENPEVFKAQQTMFEAWSIVGKQLVLSSTTQPCNMALRMQVQLSGTCDVLLLKISSHAPACMPHCQHMPAQTGRALGIPHASWPQSNLPGDNH